MFSNPTVISRSTDPTYSTVSQIQLYYLIPQSNLIQQFHIFDKLTTSIVLSRLHSHLFQMNTLMERFYPSLWDSGHALITETSILLSEHLEALPFYLLPTRMQRMLSEKQRRNSKMYHRLFQNQLSNFILLLRINST